MGRLIIDGNSVFELDEECLKSRKISKDCDVEKYLKNNLKHNTKDNNEKNQEIVHK